MLEKNEMPFLGGDGLMRVKGRLENANISYDEEHPIILPYKSTFAKRLLKFAHMKTLHGGPQVMLQHDKTQMMADLPKERLANTRPFAHCGVDYFGPIKIKGQMQTH